MIRNKKRTASIQGRLNFTFDKFDKEEPVMLVCGHTVLFKKITKYGYAWCATCGKRMPKMY